jgi:hypothetical protein
MKQEQKEFCIDIVNVAVFDNVLSDWCIVKNGSHNKYAGMVTLYFEDDEDKELHKINPQKIGDVIKSICEDDVNHMNVSDEMEMRVLLANKRLDASVLEPEDVLGIFQVAVFGEVG